MHNSCTFKETVLSPTLLAIMKMTVKARNNFIKAQALGKSTSTAHVLFCFVCKHVFCLLVKR